MTKNPSQGSINQQIFPLIPERFLSELPEPPLYDLAQARHPGWENYDGAFGEFDWDLTIDTLKHTHNDRITDYDTTEHEGL